MQGLPGLCSPTHLLLPQQRVEATPVNSKHPSSWTGPMWGVARAVLPEKGPVDQGDQDPQNLPEYSLVWANWGRGEPEALNKVISSSA